MGDKIIVAKDGNALDLDKCKVVNRKYLATEFGIYELHKVSERPNLTDIEFIADLNKSLMCNDYKLSIDGNQLILDELDNRHKKRGTRNKRAENFIDGSQISITGSKSPDFMKIVTELCTTFEMTVEDCMGLRDALYENKQIIIQGNSMEGKTLFVKMLQKLRSSMTNSPVLFRELSDDGDLINYSNDIYDLGKDIRCKGIGYVRNLLKDLATNNYVVNHESVSLLVIDEFEKLFNNDTGVTTPINTSITLKESVIIVLERSSLRGDENAITSDDYAKNVKNYFCTKGVNLTNFKLVRLSGRTSNANGKPGVSIIV